MFKRFAPNVSKPTPDARRSYHRADSPQIDNNKGAIFHYFYTNPTATISSIIVSNALCINPFEVRMLCRELVIQDLLVEEPTQSAIFRLPRANEVLWTEGLDRYLTELPFTDRQRASALAVVK